MNKQKQTHTSLDLAVEKLTKKNDMTIFDKTKIDWDKFVASEKISKELEYSRKDGYLAKKRFIDETNYKLLQNLKDEEKKQRHFLSLKFKKNV